MGFVEFTDGKQDFIPLGRGVLPQDGHASYSPDRQYLVCDTYPRGAERYAELMIYNISENRKVLLGNSNMMSNLQEIFGVIYIQDGQQTEKQLQLTPFMKTHDRYIVLICRLEASI